ncbi:MAG TPA: hypothetical protein ENK21_02795 [Trueperaceae bacterium]|nr:hypothetical protein [Trueperaceae bacterium]
MHKKLLLDINAQELNIDDTVEILTIPEWFIENLSPEDLKLLQSQIAKKLAIVDIDDSFVAIPLLIVYLLASKQIIKGLTSGKNMLINQ